jgi:hypothetical protein
MPEPGGQGNRDGLTPGENRKLGEPDLPGCVEQASAGLQGGPHCPGTLVRVTDVPGLPSCGLGELVSLHGTASAEPIEQALSGLGDVALEPRMAGKDLVDNPEQKRPGH